MKEWIALTDKSKSGVQQTCALETATSADGKKSFTV